MSQYFHPRAEQRYRDAKPATAAVPSFRCKTCRQVKTQFAGRKRLQHGWRCAECVGEETNT